MIVLLAEYIYFKYFILYCIYICIISEDLLKYQLTHIGKNVGKISLTYLMVRSTARNVYGKIPRDGLTSEIYFFKT